MSEPKVIYLGPACEVGTGDGRTWAEDNPWPDCECGHRPVQYVLGETFDRIKAERDALQHSLNAVEQRADDLAEMLALASVSVDYHAGMKGEDGEHLYVLLGRIRALFQNHCVGATEKVAQPFAEQFIEDHLGKKPAIPAQRDHQIPGTSGMRLNMLANQGE